MEYHLARPDHTQPFRYLLELDEEFLLHVMAGLDAVYDKLDQGLTAHANCDRLSTNGCVTDARSCFDALAETHGIMLSIAGFMREARFVREHREAKSEQSFRSLQQQARQVVEAAERTLFPTAQYNVLGPMGSCPDEAGQGEGQDLATRTQKVDLQAIGYCHFCGGHDGLHTLRNCQGQERPVESDGASSKIQDPQSAASNDELPQGGM